MRHRGRPCSRVIVFETEVKKKKQLNIMITMMKVLMIILTTAERRREVDSQTDRGGASHVQVDVIRKRFFVCVPDRKKSERK